MTSTSLHEPLTLYADKCLGEINDYTTDFFSPLNVDTSVAMACFAIGSVAHLILDCKWFRLSISDDCGKENISRGLLADYLPYQLAHIYCAWLKASIACRNNDQLKQYRKLCGAGAANETPLVKNAIDIRQCDNDTSDPLGEIPPASVLMSQRIVVLPNSFRQGIFNIVPQSEIWLPQCTVQLPPKLSMEVSVTRDGRDIWIREYAHKVYYKINQSHAVRLIGMVAGANAVATKAITSL